MVHLEGLVNYQLKMIKLKELKMYSCDWNGRTVHTAMTRQEKDGTRSIFERVRASLAPFLQRELHVNPRAETGGRNRDF